MSVVIKPARPRSEQTTPSFPAKPMRRSAAGQPGVMTHRLFPVLCALWFAALFGLGCLAAGADALAGLVRHLHLPAILPAAAPPLGMTARLMLGLLFAMLGGAFGLVLGMIGQARAGGAQLRRPRDAAVAEPVAEPAAALPGAPRVRSRDAHPDAPPRRPLVVTEDVLPYPTAVGDPAPVIVPVAPEPAAPEYHAGDEPDESGLPPFLAAAYSSASRGDAPIVISPAEPVIVPAIAAELEPEAPGHEAAEPAEPAAPAPVAHVPPLASIAAAAPHVPLHEAPLDSLGLVQLIERLALAIATRQARRAAAPSVAAPAEAVDPRQPLHRFDPLTMDPDGPLLRAKPPKSHAFATHDTAPSAEAQHDAAPSPILHDPLSAIDDWSNEDHDATVPPRFLGGIAHDHAPIEAHGLTAGVVEDLDDGTDDAVAEERYSSLARMTMRRPELMPSDLVPLADHLPDEGHAPLAITTDPVVQFPSRLTGESGAGRTLPVSEEGDRALREALATLRRMSAQR